MSECFFFESVESITLFFPQRMSIGYFVDDQKHRKETIKN